MCKSVIRHELISLCPKCKGKGYEDHLLSLVFNPCTQCKGTGTIKEIHEVPVPNEYFQIKMEHEN